MARNTILLRGHAREEAFTASPYAITPGMLVELDGAGDVIPHTTDEGIAFPIFAKEQHENQGAGIDTDIAVDDEVIVLFPELGAKINAFTSDTLAEGDYVTSDGAGGVRLADSGSFVIGVAAAASDLTGTNGRVEIYVGALGVATS